VRDIFIDIRHAARVLSTAPLTTGLAVLSLALAVAGVVSVFAVVDAFVLRTVPVAEPHRLVSVWTSTREGSPSGMSLPMFRAFLARQEGLSDGTAWVGDLVLNVEAGGQRGLANVWAVTDGFFPMLGEAAAQGRLLDPQGASQNDPASLDTVVIGDRLWRERFGRDPAVLGRTIRIEGVPFTVIGVSRPGFTGPSLGIAIDAVVPLSTLPRLREAVGLSTDALTDPAFAGLSVGGRLADGVQLKSACAQFNSWWPHMLRETLRGGIGGQSTDALLASRVRCESAAYGVNASERAAVVRPFYIVLALAVVVALIGGLHVALLLHQLTLRRARDLTVRLALGASRWRLLRSIMVLAALVSGAAVSLGTMLGWHGSHLILAMIADRGFLPLTIEVGATPPVLAGSATLAGLLTLLSSSASGLFVLNRTRTNITAPAITWSTARLGAATSTLLVAQVASAVALLVTALTLTETLSTWTTGARGLPQQGLLVSRLMPLPGSVVNDAGYYRALVDGATEMPGVAAAGLSLSEPGGAWQHETHAKAAETEASARPAVLTWVSPGFFDAVGLATRQGRDLRWSDTAGSERVAVVSASFAQGFFPRGDALDQDIHVGEDAVPSPVRIVGVVPDARVFDLRQPPRPTVYLPWLQAPATYISWTTHVTLRHSGDQSDVVTGFREHVLSLGREYVLWTRPVADVTARAMATERLARRLAAFYAGLALLLTVIGLFGAVALLTTRRTKEIGVRMALGARRVHIERLVLSQTLGLLVAGVLVSVPLATILHRGLRAQVVGLAAPRAVTVISCVVLALLACGVASYLPARRAARTAPATALRALD
jgi:predicted permease